VKAYRQRLQAKEQELIGSIAKIEVDGGTFTDIGTQGLADKANGSFTKESLFQQNDYDRAILGLVQAALQRADQGGFGQCAERGEPVEKNRIEGGTLGAALHPLPESAGQRAVMRRPAEVSLLE
jgi:RNA polymerase-binding transcription factor DksA